MIPKIIHYCWFGGADLPEQASKYIRTWKNNFPDYRIIEWNEQNFDIHICKFVEEAYAEKKYAFVSDYVRLYALYRMGGIYLDTDIEIIKDFREYFQKKRVVLGFEDDYYIMTAFLASEPGMEWIANLIERYNDMHFIQNDGKYNATPNPIFITEELISQGLIPNGKKQIFNKDFIAFPSDFFSAYSIDLQKIIVTRNTVCIHHCNGSWQTGSDKLKQWIKSRIIRYFGKIFFEKIKNICYN